MAVVSHYNVAPVIDIFGARCRAATWAAWPGTSTKSFRTHASNYLAVRKSSFVDRFRPCESSYVGLLSGLVFSIVLVYLLIVVNFQSWLDPFIMISALPAALAGIAWFLFITHTTLSVPALMGADHVHGRRNLKQHFGRELCHGKNGGRKRFCRAALEAGFTRFRPVIMTALAMIIGMIPMALGLGDGGEQNAPLGRAVIGGLLFATVSTLFFVPTFFSVLAGIAPACGRNRN